MTISSIIIFLSILFVLVVVHEAGHFLFAKLFKMRVDEFAFGFPPKLLGFKKGETQYSFNLIPLGGYVKIFGENGLTEDEIKNLSHEEKKRLFGSHNPYRRILVLSGGVLFNIVAAVVFFAVALMYGSNVYLTQDEVKQIDYTKRELVIVEINEKSPLRESGVMVGDRITMIKSGDFSLAGNDLSSFAATEFVQTFNDSSIEIKYVNELGNEQTIQVVPKAGIVEGKKILGAKFADSSYKKYSFFPAIYEAIIMTYDQLKYIVQSLVDLVKNLIWNNTKIEDSVSGPVGLAMLTSKVATKGIDQIFFFAALLSLSLAVFNILPIPALDGGRIVFVVAEIVFKRKVKVQVEQLFHGLGFLLLLCLMVFVTYFDIVKAFN